MNDTQKLAYVVAIAACSQARVAMMQTQNHEDERRHLPATFSPADIENVPINLGLGHSEVLKYLMEN